ncbi:MAG TPA: efflux transporter outer membrane subunit [Alphaproteobacteria bacterium]|nr:efflux transporter outer membrane subunit [Alphaproteobacteria bacterium]
MKKTALLLSLFLGGCSMLTPDYQRPDVSFADTWREKAAVAVQPQSATGNLADFWAHTQNAELQRLIKQALSQNLDLQAAVARISQARGREQAAGAPLLPSVEASGSASKNVPKSSNFFIIPSQGQAALSINYELDLFGKNRAAADAAGYKTQASVFDRDALALTVSAEVARAYVNLLALQERVEVAQRNQNDEREILKVTEARFKNGAASGLDVAQQQTDLANSEAAIATLRQQRTVQMDALAVLVGQAPQGFTVQGKNLKEVQAPAISPVQPSSLLERRPDIRSAEAGLQAANANIGAARAAFFPSINLSAGPQMIAIPLSAPVETIFNLAGSLAAPLFSGGLLEGQLELSKAQKEELIADYRKTVLVSFKEVEDTLAAMQSADQRLKSLSGAVAQSNRAYRLARDQYKGGTIDFTTLLNTQRDVLLAQDALVQARAAKLNAAIDLYRALGGAWKETSF